MLAPLISHLSASLNLNNGSPLSRYSESKASLSPATSLAIVDAQIDDLPSLLADIGADSKIVVLDPQQDGIEQITAVLTQHPQLTQLHLISHGLSGQLFLGNTQLTLNTLDRYAEQLQSWSHALQGRDLLIYGCQVAEGVSGTLFLQQLHLLTGANIAASERRVGRVADRAQWHLETQVGSVQTPVIFSQELQRHYQGSFETTPNVIASFEVINNDPSPDPANIIEEGGIPFPEPGAPPPVFDPASDTALVITFQLEGFVPGQIPLLRIDTGLLQGLTRFFLPGQMPAGLAPSIVPPSPDIPLTSAADVQIFLSGATLTLPIFSNPGVGPNPADIPGETEIEDFTFTVLGLTDFANAAVPIPFDATVNTEEAFVQPFSFFETAEAFEASLNTPPVAVDDSVTTEEDVVVVVDVLANDSDPDAGDILSVDAATDGANGTATINDDGTITYTPDADFSGTDSFTYTISDAAGETATATVSVTVDPVNDLPVAVDDSATTDEDVAVVVDVLANDTDIDAGDVLSVEAATDGVNGTTTVNPDGTITYTPNADFSGTDSFTYTISDAAGETATATVSVTVTAVDDPNTPPEAGDDSALTNEDEDVVVDVLANDSDPDIGDVLSVDAATDGANGTTTINPDGTITYTPNAGFSGTDSFTYTISDTAGETTTAIVSITVNPVSEGGGTILGTIGADAFIGGFATNDAVLSGGGDDVVDFAFATPPVSAGGEGAAIGGNGSDTINAVDENYIFGGNGNDTLTAEGVGSRLSGGDGDDEFVVLSGAEDSLLLGGDGDDTFTIESGGSVATGGEGADTFIFADEPFDAPTTIIDFEVGTDILTFAGAPVTADGETILVDGVAVVTLLGVDAAEALAAEPSEVDEEDITTEALTEVIVGSAEGEGLIGGIDFVAGDIVLAGAGNDDIDLVSAIPASTLPAVGIALSGSGSDIINVGDDDIVSGGSGNDALSTEGFGSRLSGQAGDDTFFAVSGGNNRLLGGDGNDTFNLASGGNIAVGGADSDTFVFAADIFDSVTIVADFEVGVDALVFGVASEAVTAAGESIFIDGSEVAVLLGIDAPDALATATFA